MADQPSPRAVWATRERDGTTRKDHIDIKQENLTLLTATVDAKQTSTTAEAGDSLVSQAQQLTLQQRDAVGEEERDIEDGDDEDLQEAGGRDLENVVRTGPVEADPDDELDDRHGVDDDPASMCGHPSPETANKRGEPDEVPFCLNCRLCQRNMDLQAVSIVHLSDLTSEFADFIQAEQEDEETAVQMEVAERQLEEAQRRVQSLHETRAAISVYRGALSANFTDLQTRCDELDRSK